MTTYRGNRFFVDAPEKTKFDIKDIAHALSNLCRFGGHTREFYSVADHSVLVADIVAAMPGSTPVLELWALLHDATEAYMVDIPTPLKVTLPEYKEREDALMALIADSLNLPDHGEASLLPEVVKEADRIALVTEARQLMRKGVEDWSAPFKAIRAYRKVTPMTPAEAERAFLSRWEELLEKVQSSAS